MYDVLIIGAGVAGTFIARELARYELKIVILEKDNDVGNETSSANSAIIHAGYDPAYITWKGRMNAEGNAMYDRICEELDVPFRRCGSLVIGFSEEDKKTIGALYENGRRNHVPDLEILEREDVLHMEPNINPQVQCALYAPSAGVISPWELTIALAENAMDNGVQLRLETKVTEIYKGTDGYRVITDRGEFVSRYVINCAGVYADAIHNMVAEPAFEIRPKRGNYYVLDHEIKNVVNHIVFQCPTDKGKGVLVTPTAYGNFMVGPDSDFITDKECTATDRLGLEFIRQACSLTTHAVPFDKVIRSFAGLRASTSSGDFILGEAEGAPGFIDVAAFDSPGLSSTPAVAQYIAGLLQTLEGELRPKANYNPVRRRVIRFHELSEEEKIRLIKENPAYGNVICRCEGVTEAEIVDAVHRNAGAKSVKAVKKRCRPGAGRCQGGFCGPRVLEILARELGIDRVQVPYDSSAAYILTGPTKQGMEPDSIMEDEYGVL